MSKMYVKDEKGKYKLVDRDQKGETSKIFSESESKSLSLQVLDARLKRLEANCIGPQK